MNRHSRSRGYALLFVLIMGASLFLLLDQAVQAYYALHQINRRAKVELQHKVERLHLHIAPGVGEATR